MKIVYTIPNFDTAGSGRALLHLALALRKKGFETEIVCNSDKGAFFQTVVDSGVPVHVFDYIPCSRPIFSMLDNAWRTARRWRSINPDVVHSFNYSDNYTEGLAVRLAGKKWVFTKKNMSWGGTSGRGWQLRSAFASGIAVQNTDMIKQFYPNSKKVHLIPRGVVVENFINKTPKPEIRALMETPKSARIIICVANMVPVKGVELLFQAFANIESMHSDWVVWLIGDNTNEYGQMLEKQVEELNLQSKIKFSGKQPNVREYLDHAEIFVLPTKDEGRREGSPVAMLEAMANGKVVLGSAVPGIKDQLAKYPDHLFTPNSLNDLQHRLECLMENDLNENKALGMQFQNFVTDAYPLELEVTRHANMYHSL